MVLRWALILIPECCPVPLKRCRRLAASTPWGGGPAGAAVGIPNAPILCSCPSKDDLRAVNVFIRLGSYLTTAWMACAGTPELRQYMWYVMGTVALTMFIVFGVWLMLSLRYEARKQIQFNLVAERQRADAAAEAAGGREEGLLEPLIGESAVGSQV